MLYKYCSYLVLIGWLQERESSCSDEQNNVFIDRTRYTGRQTRGHKIQIVEAITHREASQEGMRKCQNQWPSKTEPGLDIGATVAA